MSLSRNLLRDLLLAMNDIYEKKETKGYKKNRVETDNVSETTEANMNDILQKFGKYDDDEEESVNDMRTNRYGHMPASVRAAGGWNGHANFDNTSLPEFEEDKEKCSPAEKDNLVREDVKEIKTLDTVGGGTVLTFSRRGVQESCKVEPVILPIPVEDIVNDEIAKSEKEMTDWAAGAEQELIRIAMNDLAVRSTEPIIETAEPAKLIVAAEPVISSDN